MQHFVNCCIGEAQQSGSPPDATYKPTFPGVEYREHEPYAETGPRSDVRLLVHVN